MEGESRRWKEASEMEEESEMEGRVCDGRRSQRWKEESEMEGRV